MYDVVSIEAARNIRTSRNSFNRPNYLWYGIRLGYAFVQLVI